MKRTITRRDFVNGTAIAAAALISPPRILSAAVSEAQGALGTHHYPPVLTGMRGSHAGSYEIAHALAWGGERPTKYEDIDEHYDLVVVGAGMSGLAAAWYWRKRMGAEARILLLDNHDDFGGHAKRNEFHHRGRMVLNIGGAQNLENPGNYSSNAKELLTDMGIDDAFLVEMAKNTPESYFLGGNLGADTTMALPDGERYQAVNGPWMSLLAGAEGYAEAIEQLPLPATDRALLTEFIGGERDFLEGKSLLEKYRYCNQVSYRHFLITDVGLTESCISILETQLRIFMGFTGGSLTVIEAIALGSPGLNSLGWLAKAANSFAVGAAEDAIEVRMFPDGNASIARLLVQKMIPEVAPDMSGVSDVAVTRYDYSALDKAASTTRVRLNSTAVGVRETATNQVRIEYVKSGSAERVTADHCILACYNGIIPHLCPQLPEPQKSGLSYGVKVPFVYASVLLDNGEAFSKLGTSIAQCPGQEFLWVSAAPTMTTGGYEPPRGPQDPMALFMMSAPTLPPQGSESLRDLLRLARHKVYSSSFDDYETSIRNQLQALLGAHGFEHNRDIVAITVNRISHGYAYEPVALYDPEYDEGEAPHEIGRAQFGRISIANSDSEARAYMDAAWDAAFRAVNEQAELI